VPPSAHIDHQPLMLAHSVALSIVRSTSNSGKIQTNPFCSVVWLIRRLSRIVTDDGNTNAAVTLTLVFLFMDGFDPDCRGNVHAHV